MSVMEVRLLTLTEAAAATGLTVEALRQRVKRRQIVATKGNDRHLRLRLTDDDIDRLRPGVPTGQQVGQQVGQPDDPGVFKAMAEHVTTLREQLTRAQADADSARRDVAGVRAEAADERRQAAVERARLATRIDALEAENKALREPRPGLWQRLLGHTNRIA